MIGGDFKCEPDKTGWQTGARYTMDLGTQHRPLPVNYRTTMEKTHVNGGVLDWFIVDPELNSYASKAARHSTMGETTTRSASR